MRSLIDPAEIEVGEELSYLKPGLSPRLLRRLKRGQFSIADEIDLHQMTVEVARTAIKKFLDECQREARLCVKIIHGKGLRSRAQGPVLKRLTDGLLRQRARRAGVRVGAIRRRRHRRRRGPAATRLISRVMRLEYQLPRELEDVCAVSLGFSRIVDPKDCGAVPARPFG